ncbi:MAG: DUF2520 domain-containing protein [Candidatus Nanopelagicales bacterium]|jgi:predicted short-subunit dehydrogenase-like oxidoreductase (DUF2520 family)|nr:DUF2520 domain-containing protein [Candidatus Nanopelagicales bacterium]
MSADRSAAQPKPAPRLAVGVIGVGRVGGPLAAALARAGHPLVGAHAVSQRSRRQVAAFLPDTPLLGAAEVMAAADLVLLTVPDDVLPELVLGLADTDAVTPGQFLVHASGRFGTAVLEPATRLGALPMALHPVMTFTGARSDLDRLSGCPFGVTAPSVLRPVAEALVVEMGGDPMWVPEEARPLYHAALANGANHLVTLVAQTLDLLEIVGVENPSSLVRPLLTAALDNVLVMGDDALTGPVARGDAGTVAAHLDALSRAAPEARAAYVAMARLTADRALAAGRLDPAAAESLLDVLG